MLFQKLHRKSDIQIAALKESITSSLLHTY